MALSASAAASLLDNYASACLSRQTPEMGKVADQTSADTALASTRTTIVNDMVASAQTPALNTATAGTTLDNYVNGYLSVMLGLTNFIADGSSVTTSVQSARTNILNYLTH